LTPELSVEIGDAIDKHVTHMKDRMWMPYPITYLCPWGSSETKCSYRKESRYAGSPYDMKYFPEYEWRRFKSTPYLATSVLTNFVYWYAAILRWGEGFDFKDSYFYAGSNLTNFKFLKPWVHRYDVKEITSNFTGKKNAAGDPVLL
jgi:hypothetical protein